MPPAPPDAPTASPPFPAATDVLRPGLAPRLRFGLTAAWGGLVTVPFSLAQVLTHRRTPTTANFHRWSRGWARSVLAAAGVRVAVEDRARLDPARPVVFVANHQSALDILVVAAGLPYPFGFAAKAELAEVPFLGAAIRQSPSLFVDKRDARRAVQSVREAGERIRAGMSVLIFPEGVRTYRGGLADFARGAFVLALEAGVPLVPVALLGGYRLMDERRALLRPGTVGLVVHEPIPTAGLTRKDVPALVAAVEGALGATLAAYEAREPAR